MDKRTTAAAAVARIRDGDTVMVGGFGLSGTPLLLLKALAEAGRRDLTIISNNLGEAGKGLGELLRLGLIRKAIGSFFTSNPEAVQAYREGRLEVELMPQGTLAEAVRAGGAGILAFYTPTAVGTALAAGKETRRFGLREGLLVPALRADVALVRAYRADAMGNLTYRLAARNFNPMMATAADLVIAEVDEVVPAGAIPPDAVATPHLYVDLLVERGGSGDGR